MKLGFSGLKFFPLSGLPNRIKSKREHAQESAATEVLMEIRSFLGVTNEMVYLVGLPIVFALIAIEVLVMALKGVRYYKWDDTLGTLGMLAGNVAMGAVTKSLFFGCMVFTYQYRLIDLQAALPSWLLCLVALFLIDVMFYIWHRASHRVRFLWAIHLSHHASQEMNFAVAFRQPVLAPLFKIPFFSFLPILGLDPTIIVVVGTISTLWGVVGHTQIVPKLGIAEWFLNTPSAHRVHHGTNRQYVDKNYANMFIFIDRLLGTYEPEVEPVRYGLITQANTNNPISLTSMEWRNIWKDLKTAGSLQEVICYVCGPPGWKPRYQACAPSA
jgi:sterol desaturase/sphingolipid hydroxylase (fatty acid hydroxylase superfamily)